MSTTTTSGMRVLIKSEAVWGELVVMKSADIDTGGNEPSVSDHTEIRKTIEMVMDSQSKQLFEEMKNLFDLEEDDGQFGDLGVPPE